MTVSVRTFADSGKLAIQSMASGSPHLKRRVARVELVGSGQALAFRQTAQGLQVTLPANKPALAYASALRIS